MLNNHIIKIWGILFLYSLPLFSQGGDYFLKGTVNKRFNNMPVMLFTFYNDTIRSVDTTIVKKGCFQFRGKEYIKDFSLLTIGNYPDEVKSADVILEKGEIEVDMDNQIVKGGGLHDLYLSYNDSIKHYLLQINKLYEKQDDRIVLEGTPVYRKYLEWGKFTINFKKKNITNLVGQKVFRDGIDKSIAENLFIGSENAFFAILELADDDLKRLKWMKVYIEQFEKLRKEKESKNSLLHKKFIDFEMETLDGEIRKLSDFVGQSRCLVLEFWASWCNPCIAEIPRLKKIYDVYKENGLEIVSISLDHSKKAWKQAVERVDAPWQHFHRVEECSTEPKKSYKIKGIPYIVVLDKEGTIVNVKSRGDALRRVVDEMLK